MKQQLIEAIAACKQAAWVEDFDAVVYTAAGKSELQKILGEAGLTSRFADENLKVQWPDGMTIRVMHYLVTDDEFCRLTGRTKREISLRDESGALVKPQTLVEQIVLARSESDTEALIVFHKQLAAMVPAEQAEAALVALAPIISGPATAFAIDHYVGNFADIVELMPDPTEALVTMPTWTIMMLLRDEGANPGSSRVAESAWTILPYIPIQKFRQELKTKIFNVQANIAQTLLQSFGEWQDVVQAIRSDNVLLQKRNAQERKVEEAQSKLCLLLSCFDEVMLLKALLTVRSDIKSVFAERYLETIGVDLLKLLEQMEDDNEQ